MSRLRLLSAAALLTVAANANATSLIVTTDGYGAVLILLALGALVGLLMQDSARARATTGG